MRANSLPLDECIAYRLIRDFSSNTRSLGLRPIGSGLKGDKINNKLGVLDACFETNMTLTIESARKLSIECVNRFVNFLNDNGELRSYLTTFPATPKQVCIIITGEKQSGDTPNHVRTVIAREGTVAYFADVAAPPNYGLIHKETYEEAVARLQNSNP